MKVIIGPDIYIISWKHNIGNPYILSPVPGDTVHRGTTGCTINKIGERLWYAHSYCHKNEKNYIRAVGRKLSFTKVLADAFPGHEHQAPANPENREIRRQFWNVYYQQSIMK